MTCIKGTKPKRHLPAKLAAGLAISAILVLGTLASASAQERRDDGRRGDYHGDRGYGYSGGYYAAPPVVYGSPYGGAYYGTPYYAPPPPVIYGPSVGISLPGVSIGIN